MPFTITIIGAGGLGVPAAWGISRGWQNFGALHLRIIDPDLVESGNLHRQILFTESDIGRSKSEALCEALRTLSGTQEISFESVAVALDANNIETLLERSNYVLEATDSIATKLLVNDYCVTNAQAYCYAGAIGTGGQLLAYEPRGEQPGCLRCMFEDYGADDEAENSCRRAGVLGPAVGYFGFLQAEQALRAAANTSERRGSYFQRFDLKTLRVHESIISAAPHCPLGCAHRAKQVLDLRTKRCPQTFLYTKLALEQLRGDEILDARYDSSETASSVQSSADEEGFRTLLPGREISKQTWRLLFKRKDSDAAS